MEADGVPMREVTTGSATVPAVFCHATGFCGAVLEPVARRIRDVHAALPDLRGHGDNPVATSDALSWRDWAGDALAASATLTRNATTGPAARPGSRIFGFGHSGGGAALVLAEQRRPGTFAALFLFEPVVFPPGSLDGAVGRNPLSKVARQRRPDFPSREAAYANFASKPPMNAFDPEALRAYIDCGFAERPAGTVTLKCLPENEARMYELGAASGAWEALRAVKCPVVVARGATVDDTPSRFAEQIAQALPSATLEVFDHLGHFGPLEAPGEIATSFQRLIDRTRALAAPPG